MPQKNFQVRYLLLCLIKCFIIVNLFLQIIEMNRNQKVKKGLGSILAPRISGISSEKDQGDQFLDPKSRSRIESTLSKMKLSLSGPNHTPKTFFSFRESFKNSDHKSPFLNSMENSTRSDRTTAILASNLRNVKLYKNSMLQLKKNLMSTVSRKRRRVHSKVFQTHQNTRVSKNKEKGTIASHHLRLQRNSFIPPALNLHAPKNMANDPFFAGFGSSS